MGQKKAENNTQRSNNSDRCQSDAGPQPVVEELLSLLSGDQFRDWYRERQYRQNIENGTPYFNGPASVPAPERHSPSRLLKCHRQVFYQQCNAPKEKSDPKGIFWFGTRFEEDIVFPFLEREVTGPDTYVRNKMWMDTTVETDAGEVRIKGATDPIIVDEDSVPILPTEVKTKSSIDHLESPDRHHRAQVHAYMVGLSEKYDIELTDAAILYGSRESLEMAAFHVRFDDAFWEDVVEWASEHTQYRLDDELPPATPEYGWECKFCDYRERCGQGATETDGHRSAGLLPLHVDYPRENLETYLEAHGGVKLTPTLAYVYPELATTHGSHDWHCTACSETWPVKVIEWDGNTNRPPLCPSCGEDGICADLRGPTPGRQTKTIGGGGDTDV